MAFKRFQDWRARRKNIKVKTGALRTLKKFQDQPRQALDRTTIEASRFRTKNTLEEYKAGWPRLAWAGWHPSKAPGP